LIEELLDWEGKNEAPNLGEIEQMDLNAGWVKGVVIRPGVVYGKSGGLTGLWFDGAADNNVL
jgi:hypothetical protein